MSDIRIMCLGDLVGNPGRQMFAKHSATLKEKYRVDCMIVNGENCTFDGRGIIPKNADFLFSQGAHVITSGNHIFAKKEILPYFAAHKNLLRPANFPSECPGAGVTTISLGDIAIGVINLQGRVFMRELLSCPFKAFDVLYQELKAKTSIIIVDFHAETTAEKQAFGFYVDGRASLVVGTHTHVPTADERILPQGTGFIVDLGMAGAVHSSLGMKKDLIISNIITQLPVKFEVETTGPMVMTGILATIDAKTGKTKKIERIRVDDSADGLIGFAGE